MLRARDFNLQNWYTERTICWSI